MRKRLSTRVRLSTASSLALTALCFYAAGLCGCHSSTDSSDPSLDDGAHAEAGLLVALGETEKELSPYFNCFNQGFLHLPGAAQYADPSLHEAVAGMHTQLVRYPGGTNSTYWDWKRGGLNILGAQLFSDTETAHTFHTHDNLKLFADQAKVQVLHVINFATSTLEREIERLKDAESKGLAIEYIEIDNELYSPKHNRIIAENPGGPFQEYTSQSYADACIEWSVALKREFPGVQTACIGETTFESTPGEWNAAITSRLMEESTTAVDAITLHPYTGVAGVEVLSVDNVDWALSSAQNVVDRIDEALTSLPSNISTWVTEYNVFEEPQSPKVTLRWTHGLLVASQFIRLSLHPRVEMACTHTLATSSNWASLAAKPGSWESRYQLSPEQEYNRTAQGEALSLIYATLKGGQIVRQLDFQDLEERKVPSPVPDENGDVRENQHAPLLGIHVSANSGTRVAVINRSAESHTIDLGALIPDPGNYTLTTVRADPLAQPINPEEFEISTSDSPASAIQEMAPYSILTLSENR